MFSYNPTPEDWGEMEDCESFPERDAVSPEPCAKKARKILSEEARRVKRENDRQRARTRVNLGRAFSPWKKLRDKNGFKTDAEMASFLINVYLRTRTESRLEQPNLERSSSTETCESVHYEYPIMSSPNEAELDTASPPVQSSGDENESEQKDVTCQRLKGQDEWTTTNQSESTDIQDDEDEGFHTSLSVGDGRYLVDLGSSSEFVVDEECILQLFNSCRECNRQCTVRKHVKGLKLVVYQMCRFCQSHCKWTNLPDEDEDDDDDDKEDSDFQINGKNST